MSFIFSSKIRICLGHRVKVTAGKCCVHCLLSPRACTSSLDILQFSQVPKCESASQWDKAVALLWSCILSAELCATHLLKCVYVSVVNCWCSGQEWDDGVSCLWKVIWAQRESWPDFKQTTLSSYRCPGHTGFIATPSSMATTGSVIVVQRGLGVRSCCVSYSTNVLLRTLCSSSLANVD